MGVEGRGGAWVGGAVACGERKVGACGVGGEVGRAWRFGARAQERGLDVELVEGRIFRAAAAGLFEFVLDQFVVLAVGRTPTRRYVRLDLFLQRINAGQRT